MDRTETVILRALIHDEGYARRVLPFLKPEYFVDRSDRRVYETISNFFSKYNTAPTRESLLIDIAALPNLTEQDMKDVREVATEICVEEKNDIKWLLDTTETFCKDKALYNAIMESIHIIDGKEKGKTPNVIPEILKDALGVSFDASIGHDFLEDSDKRYEFYHRVEDRIPFDLDFFNKITNGGTGVGKSLFLCHHAANCLMQGRNVLYITCEMAEERIAERIDANLMDITMDDLKRLPKDIYDRKIARIMQGTKGKLVIKEYPTATANSMHFKHLLDELRLKRNFVPDILFIDYLNICASSRFKMSGSINSYTYIKAIAEELRGLAVEKAIPIFTATQTNRSGYSNTDVELTDTSESFGLPQTADFMFAIITSEQLESLGQVQIKQLKNRYADPASNRRFVIGIDRSKMKLFDLEASAQTDMVDTGQDEEDEEVSGFRRKFGRKFDQWA
jgi:replicative DNA helicase